MSDARREPTYLDTISQAIWWASGETDAWYPAIELPLWLGYAVLCIAKGTRTTSFDVHQAWSAWAVIRHDGAHRSLVPFGHLAPEVRAYDDCYRDAIRAVADALGRDGAGPDELSERQWRRFAASSVTKRTEDADGA